MGILKKKRMEEQVANNPPPQVWIEDPNGSGQLILVNSEDLDEQGHLIDGDNSDDSDSS